jgi:hypothetical protein
MCGHLGASGMGEDKMAAPWALRFLTAPLSRRRYAQFGLRGPGASFGPYPPEVPYRTPTCMGY